MATNHHHCVKWQKHRPRSQVNLPHHHWGYVAVPKWTKRFLIRLFHWLDFPTPEELNQPSKTSHQIVSISLKGLHISAQLDFDQEIRRIEINFQIFVLLAKTIFEIPSYFPPNTKCLSTKQAIANFPGKDEGRRFNSSQWRINLIYKQMINF